MKDVRLMTTLFYPERHSQLTEKSWSSQIARTEVLRILEDIEDAKLANGGWPLHSLDAASYPKPTTKWALYAGAAGVVIATEILRRAGYSHSDHRKELPRFYQNFLRDPDVNAAEIGLQIGELGILTPAIIGNPEDESLQSRARECMSDILDHPAFEITSGQTGMMFAALALYRATGAECWKRSYQQGAQVLWENWSESADGTGWVWDNDLFGQRRSYFGACHGVAGNLNAFLIGADLLPDEFLTDAINRTATTLDNHAIRINGMANWFTCTAPQKGRLFAQWCHGAPGIVTALSATPKTGTPGAETLDTLLAEASALVWKAGPLTKGSGICHGTAGNGYAFLKMYQRDGHTHWLDKAKAFAAHAIQQSQEHRIQYGQGRYSLMTGDAGLAVYLHHCLNPDEISVPGLDCFG